MMGRLLIKFGRAAIVVRQLGVAGGGQSIFQAVLVLGGLAEMVGQHGILRRQQLARLANDEIGDGGVQRLPPGIGQTLVNHLMHQVVLKQVSRHQPRRKLQHQVRLHQGIEQINGRFPAQSRRNGH